MFFLLMHYGPFSLLLTEQLHTHVTTGGHRCRIIVLFILKKVQGREQYPPPPREGRNILTIFLEKKKSSRWHEINFDSILNF